MAEAEAEAELLRAAIKSKDYATIIRLTEQGAYSKNVPMMALLKAESHAAGFDSTLKKCILRAAEEGDLDAVKRLLKHKLGGDLGYCGVVGSAMVIAARHHQYDVVDHLLQRMKFAKMCEIKFDWIHHIHAAVTEAAMHDGYNIVSLLLQTNDFEAHTHLIVAAKHGRDVVVRVLLRMGVRCGFWHALYTAASWGRIRTFCILGRVAYEDWWYRYIYYSRLS